MNTSTPSSTSAWRWGPAPHVVTVQAQHATVLLDYRTGSTTALTGPAEQVWAAHSHNDAPTTLTPDTARILTGEFVERGWLISLTTCPYPPAVVRIAPVAGWWGSREVPACLDPAHPAPWRWRLAAVPTLAVVLTVRRLSRSGRRFARLLALASLGRRRSYATVSQARHAVRSVRWAACLVPARVACLEESVAAALLLALAGRRGVWRHGIAADPFRLHAWIAGPEGRPIDEPADTDLYTPVNTSLDAVAPLRGREGARR